jgi:hypothetical protein
LAETDKEGLLPSRTRHRLKTGREGQDMLPTQNPDNPEHSPPGAQCLVEQPCQSTDSVGEQRRWRRWTEKIPLEASTDPSSPAHTWRVKLSDESPGGVGIWSDRQISPGQLLFVRASPPYEPSTWLCGEVIHCTPGRHGFLVGLQMDHHMPTPKEIE